MNNQRERIVEQAMRMFIGQGIKAVRMDDIAQQLGVSKRTLYELFGDKEGLLYLALTCYFEQNRLRWRKMCEGSSNVVDQIFIVLGDVMDSSDESRRVLDNLRKFYPAVYDRLMREGTRKNREELRSMLLRGIDEGIFTDAFDIDLAISVLYYTASALVARKELLLPEGMNERQAFVQILSNFFRGISTPEGLLVVDACRRRYESRGSEKSKTR